MPAKSNQKSAVARFFQSKVFIVSMLTLLVLVAYGYGRAFYQDYTIKQEIRELQDEIRSLETKRLESLEILDYVLSDAFVEREARTALNLKEPGEEVYVITTTNTLRGVLETEVSRESNPRLNNVAKWWYYFTHERPTNL